jgi:hypothetical protein
VAIALAPKALAYLMASISTLSALTENSFFETPLNRYEEF